MSDDTPTLTQPTANVEMARAWVEFSIETGEDWQSLQSEMARLLADGKDTIEATKFLIGAGHGSHEPEGLLVGATATVSTAGTLIYAIGDAYSLVEALPPRFQARGVVVANPTTFNTAYRFVGGASTEPPILPTREGAFLGRQKYEVSAMTSSGTAPTTGGSIVTPGDFSNFLIADRIGMNVELVTHLFGTVSNHPDRRQGVVLLLADDLEGHHSAGVQDAEGEVRRAG